MNNVMKRISILLSASAAILLLAIACVVQESPITGKERAYAYSWDEEIRIGDQTDDEIVAQYGVYESDELLEYVNRISQDVLAVSHMRRETTAEKFRNTEFTFRVLDSPVVNAFALPGGYVYVTRGLVSHLNNEAQIAMVLGHEIGHVAARHASQRGLTQAIGQVAVLGGAVLGQELLGIPGQSLLNLSSQAAQLLFLSYSRDHERESDQLGVEYSAKAGYAAAEGAEFFTSLKRISERSGQSLPNFLSTHPNPGEREETIPEKAQYWKEQGFEQSVFNTEEYMSHINGIIYGENPRQGFRRDNMFYHPDLEFQFPIPANWQMINQASRVALVSPESEAITIFSIDSESETAQGSVESFLTSNEIENAERRAVASSGRWDAYQAVFDAQSENQQLRVLLYAVEYGGNIYRFLNYSSRNQYDTFEPLFQQITNEFDALRDSEILNIQPVRLSVFRADRSAPFSDFLPADLPMNIEPEEVAIINQLELDDRVEEGRFIKIPTQ
jgi:predicted Zn-dependent protease